MPTREIKLGDMLSGLIERGGYSRNRQPIVDAIGVTPAALSQYALDKTRPSFQKLVALANFFGVSLDYLVFGQPVGAPVDHGPMLRYIDRALSDSHARASRHSDLVTRIGRVLADRVDAVAHNLAETATASREGLIQHDEVLRVERYCLQADIVTMSLGANVIDFADGRPAAGSFLEVVVANLVKGCKYRFLLAGEPRTLQESVADFRMLLAENGAGDHAQGCSFRRTVMPVLAGAGLYRLAASFELEEPGLHTQFNRYVAEGGWLGYVNRPNSDSNAAMIMSDAHTVLARRAFEPLWQASVIL